MRYYIIKSLSINNNEKPFFGLAVKRDVSVTLKCENDKYFEQLYAKYKETVYKYIFVSLSFDKSLSDDCLQDVFTLVYEKMETVMEHPNPGGYIIVTAKNLIKKYIRYKSIVNKNNKPLDLVSQSELCYDVNFEQFIDNNVNIENLKNTFINMLSERDFTLYIMFYEKKYSIAKISKLLSLSESGVKVRLYRLRIYIKDLVKKEFTI